MKRKNKGFTLIELLAVIVILGLLMAIAIPSVTKYITQSRKKTLTTTIGNYIGALTNQVNDMEYVFTATNTIYAVPIECIALERGGTNPFGEWHQASDSYWAYVLVQYNDSTSSYTYGFTFKDSAGYGLYPTTAEKLKESGTQINTDLDLTKPTTGTITNITAKENWTGFKLEDDTKLVVLEAESEGTPGDGKTTCTLCQKGDNYQEVEKEKRKLYNLIANLKNDDVSIYTGLKNESGNYNIYFHTNSETNNVIFANFCWKIVRTTSTGGVKLIYNGTIDDGICNNSGSSSSIGKSLFNNNNNSPSYVGYMYNTVYTTSIHSVSSLNSNNLYSTSGSKINYNNYYSMPSTTKILGWSGNVGSRYTCFNTSNRCYNYIYYIFGSGSRYVYEITVRDGKFIDDILEEMLWSDDVNSKDSTIKEMIESWYEEELIDYDDYIEDVIYCNDRSIYSLGGWNSNGGSGNLRFYSDNQYDLSCKNMNDRFTTNISNGNGKLKYPIGLLTAGEAYFMGNARNSGSAYWLMSPMDYYITVAAGAHSSIGIIYDYGGIGDNSSSDVRSSKLDVRPVISLKNSTIAIGTGTSDNPYVVQTN